MRTFLCMKSVLCVLGDFDNQFEFWDKKTLTIQKCRDIKNLTMLDTYSPCMVNITGMKHLEKNTNM